MNFRLVFKLTGKTLLVEAGALLLPLLVCLFYRENPLPFLLSIAMTGAVGLALSLIPSNDHFFPREGFFAVALIWLLMSAFGALPFFFSGFFPSYVDCFFESVSGFTTTGASVLTAVEPLPRGILFWRSFMHWMGGMGVLILTIALLPSLGLGALFSNNQYVTIAIPLAVLVAVGVWVLLDKTKLGYELKATGCNKFAAKYCGMAEKRNLILTMAISGGLAAMGAAMLYLTGFEQWQCTQSAIPAMGFNGIAAAFLGGLHPIGAVLSSLFIQHITNGGAYVDKTMYSAQISDFISAIIIYLCSFVLFFKYILNQRLDRRDEKRAQREADHGKGGETK